VSGEYPRRGEIERRAVSTFFLVGTGRAEQR